MLSLENSCLVRGRSLRGAFSPPRSLWSEQVGTASDEGVRPSVRRPSMAGSGVTPAYRVQVPTGPWTGKGGW